MDAPPTGGAGSGCALLLYVAIIVRPMGKGGGGGLGTEAKETRRGAGVVGRRKQGDQRKTAVQTRGCVEG